MMSFSKISLPTAAGAVQGSKFNVQGWQRR